MHVQHYFLFVALLLTSSTAAIGIASAQHYTASPLQKTDWGFESELTWSTSSSSAPLPSESYPTLTAEAIYFTDKILRLRVQPKSGTYDTSKLEPPYVVSEEVFRHSNSRLPKRANGKPAANPRYVVNVTTQSRTYAGVKFANPTITVLSKVVVDDDNDETRVMPSSSQAWAPRRDTLREIFSLGNVEFQQQWVQFRTFTSPTSYLTGFGERQYYHFLNHKLRGNRGGTTDDDPDDDVDVGGSNTENVTLLSWGTDQGTPWRRPMYGQSPFFFVADPSNNDYYGVFASNSHAANLFIKKDNNGNFAVNMTFAGGILDLFIIRGDDTHDVIKQYHKQIIGTANAPPYWSLTHHQCRWGYHTLNISKEVVARYKEADVPLGVFWNDNDPNYPSEELWTINEERYPKEEYAAWVKDELLKEDDIRYVQIIDPAIKLNNSYWVYQSAMQQQATTGNTVFVRRDNNSGNVPAVNTQWVGWAAFVDYSDPAARDWWNAQFDQYRKVIEDSGTWLDMAEISTFGCGMYWWSSCKATADTPFPISFFVDTNWTKLADMCAAECDNPPDRWNFPPRNVLNNGANWQDLQTNWTYFAKTLSMSAQTNLGRYYSTKSFYGHLQAKTMYYYYRKATGRRPFLLARANYMGSGQYMAHWLGDNNAAWHYGGLRACIDGVLLVSIMGISQTGPDTGGFAGKPNGELITRFYQTTSFFTFLRNHNSGPYSSARWPNGQEVWQYSKEVQNTIRQSIHMRYRLLPTIFTELVKVHFHGGVVLRHPATEFPRQTACYEETTTFLLGPNILVAPVTDEGVNATVVYLPEHSGEIWYDLWLRGGASSGWSSFALRGGQHYTVPSRLYEDPTVAFLRAGTVLPMHTKAAFKLRDTRKSGISLLVALEPKSMTARGEGWFDDGEDMLFADPDENPDASSDNATALRKVSYFASATSGGGAAVVFSLESTVTLAGPFPVPLPLEASATITVLFPPSAKNPPSLPRAVLFNSADMTSASEVAFVPGNNFAITMKIPVLTHDGTTSFRVEWLSAAPATTPSPTVVTPSPSGGNNNQHHDGSNNLTTSSWHWEPQTTGVFFGGIAVGLVVAFLVATIMKWRHQKQEQQQGGESTRLINQESGRIDASV